MRHRLESVRVTVQCCFCQSTNVIVSDGGAEAEPVNCSTCGAPLGPLGVLGCSTPNATPQGGERPGA